MSHVMNVLLFFVLFFLFCFVFELMRGKKDPNTTRNGPSLARQRN